MWLHELETIPAKVERNLLIIDEHLFLRPYELLVEIYDLRGHIVTSFVFGVGASPST
jgi:hypothetical protein